MITLRDYKQIGQAISSHFRPIKIVIADIQVDKESELPSEDGFAGYLLYQGSIAWVIETGEFFAMDSNGVWYKQGE